MIVGQSNKRIDEARFLATKSERLTVRRSSFTLRRKFSWSTGVLRKRPNGRSSAVRIGETHDRESAYKPTMTRLEEERRDSHRSVQRRSHLTNGRSAVGSSRGDSFFPSHTFARTRTYARTARARLRRFSAYASEYARTHLCDARRTYARASRETHNVPRKGETDTTLGENGQQVRRLAPEERDDGKGRDAQRRGRASDQPGKPGKPPLLLTQHPAMAVA